MNNNMKYPTEQFDVLIQVLKQLAVILDLKACNPHTLHYLVAQQFNEGQKHNWLYCVGSGDYVKKSHQLTEDEKHDGNSTKFINIDFKFDLYPEGCNDTHIGTAMKNALKQLG